MTAKVYIHGIANGATHVIERRMGAVFTTFGTFKPQDGVWRWVVDPNITLKPEWTHAASTFEHEGQYRGCQCSCGYGATSGDFDKDSAAINQHLESVNYA